MGKASKRRRDGRDRRAALLDDLGVVRVERSPVEGATRVTFRVLPGPDGRLVLPAGVPCPECGGGPLEVVGLRLVRCAACGEVVPAGIA